MYYTHCHREYKVMEHCDPNIIYFKLITEISSVIFIKLVLLIILNRIFLFYVFVFIHLQCVREMIDSLVVFLTPLRYIRTLSRRVRSF